MASSEFITLDAEFEELLREVARDPQSSLLRVPRPKRIQCLFDRGAPVGGLEQGLSSAERHLVHVYRNELAWLLRQACLVKLVEGARSQLYVNRYVREDREVDLTRPARIRERIDGQRPPDGTTSEAAEALVLLERCVSDPLGGEPGIGILAAASFRLQRTDEARIMAAMDLAQGASPRRAIEVLADVLANHPTPSNEASAWSQVGLAYSRLMEFECARDSFRILCRLHPATAPAWLSRLTMDIQLGDVADIDDCASTLTDSLRHAPCAVRGFVESMVRLRAMNEWTPSPHAATARDEVMRRHPGVVAEVVDVFR